MHFSGPLHHAAHWTGTFAVFALVGALGLPHDVFLQISHFDQPLDFLPEVRAFPGGVSRLSVEVTVLVRVPGEPGFPVLGGPLDWDALTLHDGQDFFLGGF